MNFEPINLDIPKIGLVENIMAIEITKLYIERILSNEELSNLELFTKKFNEIHSKVLEYLDQED